LMQKFKSSTLNPHQPSKQAPQQSGPSR
jgi:hypothetical protein